MEGHGLHEGGRRRRESFGKAEDAQGEVERSSSHSEAKNKKKKKKKLVRTRRLSKTDAKTIAKADGENQETEQNGDDVVKVVCNGQEHQHHQNQEESSKHDKKPSAKKLLPTVIKAIPWRRGSVKEEATAHKAISDKIAMEQADRGQRNPSSFSSSANNHQQPFNWKRPTVRALQIQEQQHKLNHAPHRTNVHPPFGNHVGVIGLESSRGHVGEVQINPSKKQSSSMLVDMGKVVGVLKVQEDQKQKPSEQAQREKNSDRCVNCSHGTEVPDEDSALCGDPLVYATFVAPVHQYSTDTTTDSSRQASFNEQNRHELVNSSEPHGRLGALQSHSSVSLPVHGSDHLDENFFSDEKTDWPPPIPPSQHLDVDDTTVEVSKEELDSQLAQERLSFISAGSSNNDDDDDDDDDSRAFPPLPPLPDSPEPHEAKQSSGAEWDNEGNSDTESAETPTNDGEVNSNNRLGTIRRKNKRERNKTLSVMQQQHQQQPQDKDRLIGSSLSRSRSKSCSPGRAIDNRASSSSAPTAIVIVHKRNCSHGNSNNNKQNSHEDVSESSVSFHENELCETLPPPMAPVYPGSRQLQPRNVSVPKQCEQPRDERMHVTPLYANRDSVRDSWLSSGSENQGSFGSQNRRSVPAIPDECFVPVGPTPRVPYCQNVLPKEHDHRPQTRTINSLPRRSTTSTIQTREGATKTSLSRIKRSSSRESGSNSSVRGGVSEIPNSKNPLHHGYSNSIGAIHQKMTMDDGHYSGLSLPSSSCSMVAIPTTCLPNELNESLRIGVPDLVDLEQTDPKKDLTEAIVKNLQQRFKKDHIYTSMGAILLSLNPYKRLSLYTPEVIDSYRRHCLHELPPHIYAVTDRAWRTLRDMNCDQSIVISGESGSGKTEAFKLCLQYLAAVTSHQRECLAVKYQILQSNPLFEAFGNAKTRRNNNSSRFGRYLEVYFDFKGDPVGGIITNFALEKSRVNRYSLGERNFHIFYQMLLGADIHTLKEFRLHRNPDKYVLLRGSVSTGSMAVEQQEDSALSSSATSSSATSTTLGSDNIDDKRDFVVTKRAMEDLGMNEKEIHDVFSILAAILKLGNLTFVPITNMDGTEGCAVGNEYELYDICNVLRADYEQLQNGLLTRTLECRNEILVSDLSIQEAHSSRNSLCRTLYGRLFTWLINRTNDAFKAFLFRQQLGTTRKNKVVGLLDIFGFETSTTNGFEQMIINYANEKLHQLVNQVTLNGEQEEYIKEGIEWSNIDFFDNSVICNLIERNPNGLLVILDEVSLLKESESASSSAMSSGFLGGISYALGTSDDFLLDESQSVKASLFLQQLEEKCQDHPHIEFQHYDKKYPTEEALFAFKIKHFAGTVTYSAHDFIERNSDLLDRDLSRAMFDCQHDLLKTLFPEGNPRRTTRRRPATTGTQFKISMGVLVNSLKEKNPHFVYCLKPNELKQAKVFDRPYVSHQVASQCLTEKLMLRRDGFAFRMEYDQFLQRFKMLSHHTWPSWRGPSPEGVTYLLREISISASEYAFGRTMIFVRSMKTVEIIEDLRRARIDDLATLIQKTYRGYVTRSKWMRLRDSQIIISTFWKRWKDKSNIMDLKQRRKEEWAAIVIQKFVRSCLQSRYLVWLAHSLPSKSPICKDWPPCPVYAREASALIRRLHHKWRCHRYRLRFDQIARNRMREKVTASILFRDRKASYPRSVIHPFLGDYVRLRQNPQWKKVCLETNDQYVVFADIINKITRSSGKFVPILFVISTSSMLIMDQRTMQIKYRIPANEIFKISLSPYNDDIAVIHVKSRTPTREIRHVSTAHIPGCLSSETIKHKGDFVLQTGHVIEIVTKLFLVVQNAMGKPPSVNISTEFEADFGGETNVWFTFRKTSGIAGHAGGHVKLVRRGNRFEVQV